MWSIGSWNEMIGTKSTGLVPNDQIGLDQLRWQNQVYIFWKSIFLLSAIRKLNLILKILTTDRSYSFILDSYTWIGAQTSRFLTWVLKR